ncbi:MAG: hydroxyacid dehydrogenase [Candidatus Komeilibacteria bacterium CG11_big_fil_rev_8_21_14_0_20_36_20]|uniref:Hydroxyacid dehydrogenase n=1 Tax=Candidatus Komeilibacteria bacterium CG11_big_fil_rev_8_21_14_0_20_36_20 TaxID=1974477 RepID=A0A2H0NCN4_9BACT|nr:MAG: hydroxyacid dehydrogenase [Candidatus Komeilibacteria bacterium CG11_big_fil_rev_8_21_14_0_20_36_20]PIR81786.1 MAG: hydroxyacid dehydrogenase [Candidatus Komeilibacteria bacterium CG10_big_fil_rev_8_21_14_0_10_36_65]PJC55580.1 MAG: hydroxyacid dehydrogenase [Candidatus Komeilibacteria bacterium CG_4_9_14_0_2_um_filter_36_13]
MNITFLEVKQWEETYLREKLGKIKNVSLNFFSKPSSQKVLKKIKATDILGVFIYSNINQAALAALPNLKFIATMSTGFDHLDLKACQARKITISNVPFYGENTVAEHTFALILALSRRLFPSVENARKYQFDLSDINLRGHDLKDKTIGIVGFGHIGQRVAKIAKGFEMKVIAFDPHKDQRLAKKLDIKYVSFEYLLGYSDIISLHAPYNKKTHHLINKNNIKLIHKGTCLINTARGGLVETQALVTALKKKIITCAGLDVLEEEHFIKEEKELLAKPFQEKTQDFKTILQGHLLIQDPRVLVTPHNAFNSVEALQRILDTTIDNIKGYLNHKIINQVK